MKKFSWLVLSMLIVVFACDPLGFDSIQNLDVDGAPLGTYTITLADGTQKVVCNSTTWQLNAGNTFKNAGFVNVSNDNEFLYITVNSTYGFQSGAEQIKIWVGNSLDLLPKTQGQYPIKLTTTSGVNEYSFKIAFTEIEAYGGTVNCSSKLFVYVHGDVISDANGGTDTAWGGNNCTKSGNGAGNWGCYGIYQASCCNNTPPPPTEGYTQTAFAKGGYVFTSDRKSNPESLPSLGLTRNRWGWAINVKTAGETSYEIWAGAGLNYTSKGTLVGTLTVNWDGTNATVSYSMNSGFTMEGVHVYAGDTAPTTIAPGQYGNIASFDPNATSYSDTYAVSDANNDGIWIIAHAGVYGNY